MTRKILKYKKYRHNEVIKEMEEVYLTVKELAELKGCTERYIRSQITKEKICVIQKTGLSTGQGGMEYRIPVGL